MAANAPTAAKNNNIWIPTEDNRQKKRYMGLGSPDKSLYISTIVGLKPPSLQTSFSSCFSFFSVGMLPGKIQLTCRAPLFDWLVREQWARLRGRDIKALLRG
ncbi:hypothetical protein CHARACLAT_008801 [Characodon lateralis]|uniref:Uncharacterized protein n=1 Tax=Characodon lateralis TaxID=208331 RepID=A0ABU7CW22_9TELE|nr:hypothetical protein [Characodon lateralis]